MPPPSHLYGRKKRTFGPGHLYGGGQWVGVGVGCGSADWLLWCVCRASIGRRGLCFPPVPAGEAAVLAPFSFPLRLLRQPPAAFLLAGFPGWAAIERWGRRLSIGVWYSLSDSLWCLRACSPRLVLSGGRLSCLPLNSNRVTLVRYLEGLEKRGCDEGCERGAGCGGGAGVRNGGGCGGAVLLQGLARPGRTACLQHALGEER